ncbi:MAG: hypothetical protein EHM49_00260 [Deltaproteobacteria bacterium]|nr:MAG: hypothetical protein EHM49_00260 [Deltaproteobacteria bacterium]
MDRRKNMLMGTPCHTYGGVQILWEGVPECTGKKCIIYDKCLFPKVGKCGFRKTYIRSVVIMLTRSLSRDSLTQLKIGTMLCPLFNQLFLAKMKFMKDESSAHGREVREVLRSIEAVLRTLPRKASGKRETPGSDAGDYYRLMEKAGAAGDIPEEVVAVDRPLQKRRGRPPGVSRLVKGGKWAK